MWSLAALGRPTIWLIPPASVEAVTLQLQSDLLVVFGAVAFATLLVSELAFAKTLLAFTMILPRSLFAFLEVFPEYMPTLFLRTSGPRECPTCQSISLRTRCTHLRTHHLQRRGDRPCRGTRSHRCCPVIVELRVR